MEDVNILFQIFTSTMINIPKRYMYMHSYQKCLNVHDPSTGMMVQSGPYGLDPVQYLYRHQHRHGTSAS